MAANQNNTSIPSSRNTEYFAVVDKLYKPNDGEKVFDIKGKLILVKIRRHRRISRISQVGAHRSAAEAFKNTATNAKALAIL